MGPIKGELTKGTSQDQYSVIVCKDLQTKKHHWWLNMGDSHPSLLPWKADHVLFLGHFLSWCCSPDWCLIYVITWASVGGIRSWIKMVVSASGNWEARGETKPQTLNWQWSQSGLSNVRISSISGGFTLLQWFFLSSFKMGFSPENVVLQSEKCSGCLIQDREATLTGGV